MPRPPFAPIVCQEKEGVPKDSLSDEWVSSLEDELQGEFKLAHASGRTGGCVMLNVRNDTVAQCNRYRFHRSGYC